MSEMSISYSVPLIPQTSDHSCWAAGIAMILAWKRGISIDPRTIAANRGSVSYMRQFRHGLDPEDTFILHRWGFILEAPQSYSPDDFAGLLERYGPLWVAASISEPHIRVVTGFKSAAGGPSFVIINDPWEEGMIAFRPSNRGSTYRRSYRRFTREVEHLAGDELGVTAPIYVAHLP
jgi:hypothetical protein